MPKAAASATIPSAKLAPEASPVGGPKSLTVKLEAADYWALRDYCTQRERETGQRVTHQQAMVMALHKLLGQAV
jgi:hypothetical protein